MQSLLVSHTHRYHRNHGSSGHVWQGRYKSPVIQDDGHLLTVLRYIEANPVRAGMVTHPGDYRWSSFAAHGLGSPDHSLDRLVVYDDLAKTSATRCACWAAYVQEIPDGAELADVRRSNATGLPFGEPDWVEQLGARLGLDLTIRPRGRPRKIIPDDEQVEALFLSTQGRN
jgi:putative transposase